MRTRHHHELLQAAATSGMGIGEIVGALGLLVPLALRPIGEKLSKLVTRKPARKDGDQ